MKNKNRILMKTSDGWFRQLLTEIYLNTRVSENILNHPEHFDYDAIINHHVLLKRNKRVLEYLSRKKGKEEITISPEYFETILYILLENSTGRNSGYNQPFREMSI